MAKVYALSERLARKTSEDIGKNRLVRKKPHTGTPLMSDTRRFAIVRPTELITAFNPETGQLGSGKAVFLNVDWENNELEEYKDLRNQSRDVLIYNPFPFVFKYPYPRCLYAALDTCDTWVITGYAEMPMAVGEIEYNTITNSNSFVGVRVISPAFDEDYYRIGMLDYPGRDSSSTTPHLIGAKPCYYIKDGTRVSAGQRVHLQYDMHHGCWFFFVNADSENPLLNIDSVALGFVGAYNETPIFISNNASLYEITGRYVGKLVDIPITFGASWYECFCIVNGVYVHIPVNIDYISRITYDNQPHYGESVCAEHINRLLDFDLDFSNDNVQGRDALGIYVKYQYRGIYGNCYARIGNNGLSPHQIYGNVLSNNFSGVCKAEIGEEEKWIRVGNVAYWLLEDNQVETHNFELPDGIEQGVYRFVSEYKVQGGTWNETGRLLLAVESYLQSYGSKDYSAFTGQPYIAFDFRRNFNGTDLLFRGTNFLNRDSEYKGCFISIGNNQNKYGWYELYAVPSTTNGNAVFKYKYEAKSFVFSAREYLASEGKIDRCIPTSERYSKFPQNTFSFIVQKINNKYVVVINCLYWIDLEDVLSQTIPYENGSNETINVELEDIFELAIAGQTVRRVVRNGKTYFPKWNNISYTATLDFELRDGVSMNDIIAEPTIGSYQDIEHYCYDYDVTGRPLKQSISAYAIELNDFIEQPSSQDEEDEDEE